MSWMTRLVAALRAAAKEVPEEGIVEGDAVEVMRQLATGSFDHAFVDPPYNIAKKQGLAWEFSSHVTLEAEWDQFEDAEAYVAFTRRWLDELLRVVKKSGNIVVFGSYHNIHLVGAEVQRRDLRIVNEIVWEKTNAQPNITGRMFCECAEFAIWFVNAPAAEAKNWTFNYAEMKAENGGKQMRSVWQLPTTPASEKRWGKHPTQKSLAVMGRLVRALSKPGEKILDCFAGSGTTIVSAYANGRTGLGIERDPENASLAKRRVAALDEADVLEAPPPSPAKPVPDEHALHKNLARKLWALGRFPPETADKKVVDEFTRVVELAGPPVCEPQDEDEAKFDAAFPSIAAAAEAAREGVLVEGETNANDVEPVVTRQQRLQCAHVGWDTETQSEQRCTRWLGHDGPHDPPTSARPAAPAVLGANEASVAGAREDQPCEEAGLDVAASPVPTAVGDGAQQLVAAAAPAMGAVRAVDVVGGDVGAQLPSDQSPGAVENLDGRVVLEDVARARSGDGA